MRNKTNYAVLLVLAAAVFLLPSSAISAEENITLVAGERFVGEIPNPSFIGGLILVGYGKEGEAFYQGSWTMATWNTQECATCYTYYVPANLNPGTYIVHTVVYGRGPSNFLRLPPYKTSGVADIIKVNTEPPVSPAPSTGAAATNSK